MSKKPKTPAPDYKEMARKYVTWKAEDEAFIKESRKNIEERNRVGQSQAIARYAASGGSASRVEGIRKEYAQKLSEDMEEHSKTAKQMRASLEGGYTARTLRKRYKTVESNRLKGEAEKDLRKVRGWDSSDGLIADYLAEFNKKWAGQGVTARRDWDTGDYYAQVDKNAITDAGFDAWARRFSGINPANVTAPQVEAASTGDSQEGRITLRRGERPRSIMSTQVQVNPWMMEA